MKTYDRHDPKMRTENVRAHLEYLWTKATQLDDSESPLTSAIIQECMDYSEPSYHFSEMARSIRTLADDCLKFAEELNREAEDA